MNRYLRSAAMLALSASLIHAQSTAFGGQVAVETTLKQGLNSKTAKTGQEVSASLEQPATIGNTAIPRGSLLLGHVVDVSRHSNDTPNGSITLVFDHIKPKNGDPLEIRASIYRIAPSEAQVRAGQPDTGGGMRGTAADTGITPALREGSDQASRTGQGAVSASSAPVRIVSLIPGVALSAVASEGRSGILAAKNNDVQVPPGTDLVVGVAMKP